MAKGVRATGPYPVFVNTPQKRVVPNTQRHRKPREPKITEPQAPCPEFGNTPQKRVVSVLKVTPAYAHDRVAAHVSRFLQNVPVNAEPPYELLLQLNPGLWILSEHVPQLEAVDEAFRSSSTPLTK